MRRSMSIIGLTVLMISLTATVALACGCGKTAEKGSMPPSCQCSTDSCGFEEPAVMGAVAVNNTVCPVSGKPIGSMGEGVTSTYQGKTYRLCCGGCASQFKADPEKFIKNVEENG